MPVSADGKIVSLCALRLSKQVLPANNFKLIFKLIFHAGHSDLRICTQESLQCIYKINIAFTDPTSSMFRSCGCLRDCEIILYPSLVTSEKLSPKHLQNYTSTGDYALEAEVSIFYRENEFLGYKRVVRLEKAAFLSNIGAILWLFLGASVLSVVEVIYFFTLRFFNNLWIV